VSAVPATFLALALTRLAALRLVSEILIGEKLLLSCSEDEICVAVDALQYSILKLWHLPGSCPPPGTALPEEGPFDPPLALGLNLEDPNCLLEIPATLLPVSLTGQRLLDPFSFARFQVEGMLFHFLDDVLLLDFSLEPAEGIL
jgi:hypothetical protein